MKMFTVRKQCIFCDSQLTSRYFDTDLDIPVAVYCVGIDIPLSDMSIIPYNVSICDQCGTGQTVYLGALEDIYRVNHADSTGTTMKRMHIEFNDLINKYSSEITGILEIGSSKGELADLIIHGASFNHIDYYIVEPHFFGNPGGKHIISDFYENVDDSKIHANTMIISHVFEHFYYPNEILDKISKNKNIQHFFLAFPDLEYYVQNNILHVLNTEHTYYTDNNFIAQIFTNKGFDLKDIKYYKGHSVFMHFIRRTDPIIFTQPINIDSHLRLDKYFSNIYDSVRIFNNFLIKSESKFNYIFPCSIHSIFLLTFGLDTSKLHGMLDNSPNKIGQKVYGTELICYSFKQTIETTESISIILNGGVFNSEIISMLENKPNIRFITP